MTCSIFLIGVSIEIVFPNLLKNIFFILSFFIRVHIFTGLISYMNFLVYWEFQLSLGENNWFKKKPITPFYISLLSLKLHYVTINILQLVREERGGGAVDTERNWVFATNSDFIIPISLQPNVVDLRHLKP